MLYIIFPKRKQKVIHQFMDDQKMLAKDENEIGVFLKNVEKMEKLMKMKTKVSLKNILKFRWKDKKI